MKKLKIIGLIGLALIAAVYIVAWFGMRHETKERIRQCNEDLVNSVMNLDFSGAVNNEDTLKLYLKKLDGSELSNRELHNFLVNTGLYRLTFYMNTAPAITYSHTVDFHLLDADSGKARFWFRALDGDEIVTTLEYQNGHFVTQAYYEPIKETKQYPFAIDGLYCTVDHDSTEPDDEYAFCRMIIEKDYGAIEIFQESREDMELLLLFRLQHLATEHDLSWNETRDEFIIRTDDPETIYNTLLVGALAQFGMASNALAGNQDWHLTVLFYKGSELLKTLVIR